MAIYRGKETAIVSEHIETDKLSEEEEIQLRTKADLAAFDNPKVTYESVQARELESRVISYLRKRVNEEGIDALQINNLVFSMPREVPPPTLISIDSQALNYTWQTLRTKSAHKAMSGHGTFTISFTVYFVGVEAINEGFRQLLASFDSTPFVFIENDFIRANAVPGYETETMACSLLDMVVRTEEDLKDTIAVDLVLMWFNYKPFSPHFRYRRTWTLESEDKQKSDPTVNSVIPQGDSSTENMGLPTSRVSHSEDLFASPLKPTSSVKFPENSEPLVERLEKQKTIYPPVSRQLTSGIGFGYHIYKTLSTARTLQIRNEIYKPGALKELSEGKGTWYRAHVANPERKHLWMNPEAADAFIQLAEAYYEEWGKILIITSCFRTRQEQLDLIERDKKRETKVAAKYSWHETGLAVDLAISGHQMSAEQYKWLLENAPKYGWSNLGLRIAKHKDRSAKFSEGTSNTWEAEFWRNIEEHQDRSKYLYEGWHFEYEPLVQSARKRYGSSHRAIKLITKELTRLDSDNSDIENARQLTLKELNEQLNELDKKNSPWEADYTSSSSSYIVLKRPIEFTVDDTDTELIPTRVVISKKNIVAPIPVLSHEFATQQYLGSTDMEAEISFIAVGTEKLRALQQMVRTVQSNARSSRQAKEAGVVRIYNQIFNLMGFDRAFVERVTAQSIEGQPDSYNVRLILTEYKRLQPQMQQEKYIDNASWAILAKHFYNRFISGTGNEPLNSATSNDMRVATDIGDGYAKLNTVITIADLYNRAKEFNLQSFLPDLWEVAEVGRKVVRVMQSTERRLLRDRESGYTRGSYHRDFTRAYVDDLKSDVLEGKYTDGFRSQVLKQEVPVVYFRESERSLILEVFEYRDRMSLGLKKVFSIYLLVLFAISVRQRISSFQWLERVGLPTTGLFPERWIDQPIEEGDEDFELAIEKALREASRLVYHEGLNAHDAFIDFFFENAKEFAQWRYGSECYPDLNLPDYPSTPGVNVFTEPDYYFYNEDDEGGLAFSNTEYKDRARVMMENTWRSAGIHATLSSYDNDIISFNKYTRNDNGFLAEHLTPGARANRAASTVLHDADLEIKRSWNVKLNPDDHKLSVVLNQIPSGDFVQHFYRNHPFVRDDKTQAFRDAAREIEFGTNPDVLEDIGPKAKMEGQLEEILEGSWNDFKQNTYRMSRAFPTFKIYFIEDDQIEEGVHRHNQRNFDDFYSYSAIKDMRIVRSRKWAADLCVITIVNTHGELDFLAYGTGADLVDSGDQATRRVIEKYDPLTVDTKEENPFERLVVVEGSKIQIRLGYSNHPDKLETLFNGQVVEVALSKTDPNIVQISCQSYATELTTELKGADGRKMEFVDTQELLSCMICSPEVTHFGRWKRSNQFEPNEIRTAFSGHDAHGVLDGLIQDMKWEVLKKWEFLNKPQDDNIFAPDFDTYRDAGGVLADALDTVGLQGAAELFFASLKRNSTYHPFNVTIWDIFKEMELRHPGYVALPVPYGQRYTMYFGPPSNNYWSRPLDLDEQNSLSRVRTQVKRFFDPANRRTAEYQAFAKKHLAVKEDFTREALQARQGTFSGSASGLLDAASKYEEYLKEEYQNALLQKENLGNRFKPLRRYWMLTSENHIVANHIRASSHGTHNAVELDYFDDAIDLSETVFAENAEIMIDKQRETLKMKADDNIPDEKTRIMKAQYFSCYGDFFARRYAVGLMMKSLRDTYKGELVILGNPSIKPYDICYIYDTYSDMFGPIEVEQVVHTFSRETGFITQITPDLILQHNDWASMGTVDAMQHISNHYLRDYSAWVKGGTAAAFITGLGVAGGAVGLAALLVGGYKFVSWTQERQPIVMTPLIQRHKPLLAGVDGYKFDSFLANVGGKWTRFKKDFVKGWEEFWDSDRIKDWALEHISDLVNR